MPKFLTVPTWYDKNGQLNQMLTGDARSASTGPKNVSIGENSSAGVANGSGGSVVIGYGASGENDAVVVGALSSANTGGIAIGRSIIVSDGGIGIGGSAYANQIQLGNKSTKYDLTVGDGNGTAKIGTLVLGDEVLPNNISSAGLYLCTASVTVSEKTSWASGLIWINHMTVNAYAVNGSVSFKYNGSNHTITCEGTGAEFGKCFKIFQK